MQHVEWDSLSISVESCHVYDRGIVVYIHYVMYIYIYVYVCQQNCILSETKPAMQHVEWDSLSVSLESCHVYDRGIVVYINYIVYIYLYIYKQNYRVRLAQCLSRVISRVWQRYGRIHKLYYIHICIYI